MRQTMLDAVNTLRRTALVEYYLHNFIPQRIPDYADKIRTQEDLYEYLLIDPGVSAKVTTSPIAEAIASIQLYIHRCLEHMEPGVQAGIIRDEYKPGGYFVYWNRYYRRYATWAGLKRLLEFPSSYLDPALRYRKTEPFKALEKKLQAGTLTEMAAEDAVRSYVDELAELADLQVINGHQEQATLFTTYHFIGRTRSPPFRYYRRSFELISLDSFTWGPWVPLEINPNAVLDKIQICRGGDGVFYLAWLEIQPTGEAHSLFLCWARLKTEHFTEQHRQQIVSAIEYDVVDLCLTIDASFNIFFYYLQQSNPITWWELKLSPDGWIRGESWITNTTWMPVTYPGYHPRYVPAYARLTDRGRQLILTPGNHVIAIADQDYSVSFSNASSRDIEALFDYRTQFITYPEDQSPFVGCIEPYAWELFLHVPWLVANRFLADYQFDVAERWLKFLFNPAGYRRPDGSLDNIGTRIRYWNVRPLVADGSWNITDPPTIDPDEIALNDPMHYKLAIYLATIRLMQERGDARYRMLERDSLAEAKMWYVQALALLGPRPYVPEVRTWRDPTLGDTANQSNRRLRLFTDKIDIDRLPAFSSRAQAPFLRQVDSPFHPPFNDEVLLVWDRLLSRLDNLRHSRSIDGQPLYLPLFATPVSPRDIQRQESAGDGVTRTDSPLELGDPHHYRFTHLLERAQAAAEHLRDVGGDLLDVLDRRDAEALTNLEAELAEALFTDVIAAKVEHISSLEKERAALQADLASVAALQAWVDERLRNQRIYEERSSETAYLAASVLFTASSIPYSISSPIYLLPTIFGFANGGHDPGSAISVLGNVLEAGAQAASDAGEMLAFDADYQRRVEEWNLQQAQAKEEATAITERLAAQDSAIASARHELALARREHENAKEVLRELRRRFTNIELFDWLKSRMSSLYRMLYDNVASLCNKTKATYRWETEQDPIPLFPEHDWDNQRNGLLAGEALMVGLLRLERAYLDWDTHALEIRKTLRLTQLVDSLSGDSDAFGKALVVVINGGAFPTPSKLIVSYDSGALCLTFDLKDFAIVDDYPDAVTGKSRRFIRNISATFDGELQPFEDVRALLNYSGSAIRPNNVSAAFSRAKDDSGLLGRFELDFEDNRYYPFEGLPISEGMYALRFPGASTQAGFIGTLRDIVLHLNYWIL